MAVKMAKAESYCRLIYISSFNSFPLRTKKLKTLLLFELCTNQIQLSFRIETP